jgi:putative ABC transport system permease protein
MDAIRGRRVGHARLMRWSQELGNDLGHAFRLLRRSPDFTTMAVVSLALGIGANTAVFTLLDGVMLRSLPVRSPDELVSVGDASRPTALWEGAPMVDVLSYPLYERLRDQNRVFTGLLASGRAGHVEMTTGAGAVETVRGRLVSSNYFEVLGVSPVRGRAFSGEDDRLPGASPAIVISDDFWERRFARDPGILGRVLRLNGSPFNVIGVAPRRFTGEVVGSPTDVWIPLSMQAQVNPGHPRLERRDSNWLLAMGRLKPHLSIEQARAEMTRLAQEALMDYAGATASTESLREIREHKLQVQPGAKGFSWIRKNTASLLFTLMAAVGLVLAIACANVANLLLARATRRAKEISLRLALGAGRGRVIRQLLTEGAVLAFMGGAAGLLLAGWGSRVLSRLVSSGGANPIPFDVDVEPDLAVLAFTSGVSLLTAILFALVPAVRATAGELSPALKQNTRTLQRGGWPLGKVLVIGQVALSLPLLVGAGLFGRSLANLEELDVGYSRHNLLLLTADLRASGYVTTAQQISVTRALIEHLQSVPAVLGATVSENGLFSGTDSTTESLQVDGLQSARGDHSSSRFDQVGPHYFEVLGIPILAGRDFDERDVAGAHAVTIINDTMARFYFGEREPLGRSIRNGGDRYTIVGVVRDSRQRDLKAKAERRFYLPLYQAEDAITAFNFEIRTRESAARSIPVLRRRLDVFGRNLKVTSLEPVRTLMSRSIGGERSIAQLTGFFSVLALLLAAAGLYGVMSYATARRANEIGLRMALGADRGHVTRMVLRETATLIGAGFALGLPAAMAATRLTTSSLVGVSAGDPATMGGATLLMLIVGTCAGLVPARRASRIDPVVALRQD